MREYPILFSAPMVSALLREQNPKSMTRRIVKPQPPDWATWVNELTQPLCTDYSKWVSSHIWQWSEGEQPQPRSLRRWPTQIIEGLEMSYAIPCRYGVPGDRLWVRETLRRNPSDNIWYYNATPDDPVLVSEENHGPCVAWAHHKEADVCVSIHMPRWASRITLEITNVRAERVQDISEEDAKAEGAPPEFEMNAADFIHGRGNPVSTHKLGFKHLWDSINGKTHPWANNDWVWVLEFKRVSA